MLALVFVRKVLDLCFSKRELSYLDDLMPEWKKKNLDDASKKIDEVVQKNAEKKGSLSCVKDISNVSRSFVQESQVMLSEKKDDAVQIPMESSKPAQYPRSHDPR